MRLISSQRPRPTSPTQSSDVPGRKAILKGLRRPWAMIRRAFRSGLEKSGFVDSAAPLSGLTRMIEPSRLTGSPLVRRSCARRLPPSAVGGVRTAPTPPGGSPHGLSGLPSWPQSVKPNAAPSPDEA